MFHYCSSCTHVSYKSRDFCSSQCWEKSPEYVQRRTLALGFYITLQPYQIRMCKELMSTVFDDEDYYNEFERWIKECKVDK